GYPRSPRQPRDARPDTQPTRRQRAAPCPTPRLVSSVPRSEKSSSGSAGRLHVPPFRRTIVKTAPKLRARRLAIEPLEKRQLLTSGITAAINSAGVLSILGTDGDDTIRVRQTAGHIMIAGVNAAWMANRVKSIDISLGGGNDFVSLASRANGGNQTLNKHVTVSTGPGDAQVKLNPGHDVYLNDSGETLDYSPGGAPKVNGTTVGKVTATISSSGVLTVTGTSSDDSIKFKQSGGKISISGIRGSWSAPSVTAIVVNPQGGTDLVSLDSIANGGTQV